MKVLEKNPENHTATVLTDASDQELEGARIVNIKPDKVKDYTDEAGPEVDVFSLPTAKLT